MIPPQRSEKKPVASYTVSVAAELTGMHAQTLRQYDRLGLVTPSRTKGRGRRYSAEDIEKLRHVRRLSQEGGINLAGVQHILRLETELEEVQRELAELRAALERDQMPTKGVFTADSTGRVHFRPHTSEEARTGQSDTVITGRASERALVSSRLGAPALQLSKRRSTVIAERGLVGWKLLASLRIQQARRDGRTTRG